MFRIAALAYGLVTYGVFFVTFLYAVGFTGGFVVPKAIDDGPLVEPVAAVTANLLLLALFAVQHSLMARPAFKRAWTRIVPPAVERSTYVLLASLALALLFWQWRPLPTPVWSIESPLPVAAIRGLFWLGWAVVLASTFMISHTELFGLRQVIAHWRGVSPGETGFRTPLLYAFVRHPIYLGFLIAFWSTPTMTVGHLVFALATTAYILIGIRLEERDLVAALGARYLRYRASVGMLLPRRAARRSHDGGGQAHRPTAP